MSAPSSTVYRRGILLTTAAITILIAGAELHGHGNDKPRLTITSPRHGLTTTQDQVEVTVSLASRHEPADTIVLIADGVEADRLTLSSPTDRLTHTFLLDLSGHPDGLVRLRARATRAKRKKTLAVAHSEPVRLRLDRDISDGVLVGRAGGELISADGALTLSIPNGALERPRQITITSLDPTTVSSLPQGVTPLFAYELLPDGLRFARPATVTVTRNTTAIDEMGSLVAEPVTLFTISGGHLESLSDSATEISGNLGVSIVRGSLSHFSDLAGWFDNDRYRVVVTPPPYSVDVNAPFTVRGHFTDDASSSLGGGVYFDDTFRSRSLERLAPEGDILLGPLTPNIADRSDPPVPVTYACRSPGVAVFGVRGTRARPSTLSDPPGPHIVSRLFCHDDVTRNGRMRTTVGGRPYTVGINPVQQTRAVETSGTSDLAQVQFNASGLADNVSVTVTELTSHVLSTPVVRRPTSASSWFRKGDRNSSDKLNVRVFSGPSGVVAEETIEWSCQRVDKAHVLFEFEFRLGAATVGPIALLATIDCVAGANRPPRMTLPPADSSPIPPGAPRSWVILVDDPDGPRTVWELLIHPDGMTIDPQTGEIQWTPRGDQTGTHPVRVRVSDTVGGVDIQDFTLTVAAAPPIPNSVIVPSLIGLIRGEAIDQILLVGLVLGNIIEIVDPLAPIERVLAQTPLANTVAALGSAVDLLINVARDALTPVAAPEGLQNTTTFNLPPGNRITIAGTNGFAIVDAITGETPSAGTDELLFTGNGLGPFFGALVLTDPQGTGGDSIFAYGPAGTAMTIFDPVANHLGAWLVSARPFLVTDAIYFGGDPAAPGALFVNFSSREIYPLVPVDFGASRGFTWQRPMAERFAFESAPAGPVSAFAWDLQFNSDASLSTSSPGRVLAVTDGSPGRIYVLNPATPSTPGVDLGAAGNSPRQVRCAPTLQLCVVSNFDSDELTVVRWDGRTTASIVGSVPVGDGPVGIGIVADGTTARVISTGFNDHTYTVTRLAADGMLLSNDTQPAPAGCANPGHAIWLDNSPTTAVLSCRTSNSFSVVTP